MAAAHNACKFNFYFKMTEVYYYMSVYVCMAIFSNRVLITVSAKGDVHIYSALYCEF